MPDQFHSVLRAAIEDSGLTLDRLRHRLAQRGIQVSVTSLSYWQQGRSRPERADSLRAVHAIETILGMPRHSLAALLGPPRPRGRWTKRDRNYDGILAPSDALAEAVTPMIGPSDSKLRVFSQEDSVRVGTDRAIQSVHTRFVVETTADGPDRHLAVYCAEPGTDSADISVKAVANCRLGRVRRHPGAAVIAAELLFDRRLRIGETQFFDYAITISAPTASFDYRRGFRYPADVYVLRVQFGALPARVHGFTQVKPHGTVIVEDELIVTSGQWVHRAERTVKPGVIGIGWEWD
ncbi:transcriptional regulator [Kibdelosporangium aridum]|uniref:Transcriptional regulator n=1 Tax=Kibdelosporangium aridum TaxID=2030 RepID=A0A428ZRI3_KIBAR|nr:transcriptional regulator [Kibdelosporangium aridum]RSM90665.1 transcriptional regulator [Kibdelosporangium aridum]